MSPLRIAAVYFFASVVWIVITDSIVALLFETPALLAAQTTKGVLFVAFTTGLVYLLARRMVRHADLQLSERQFIEARNLLDKVLAGIDDSVFLVESGTRTILACNPAAERVFGYSADELVGQCTEILHVDHGFFDEFGTVSEAGVDAQGVFHARFRMKRKDGTILETENTVAALHEDLGWKGGVISIVRDVSAESRAREALRESDARYRAVVELARDIIVTTDLNGQFTLVNEAGERAAGWSREEILTSSFYDWIHPDDLENANATLQHVIATSTFATTELRTRTADGSWLHLEATVSPEYRDGQVVGVAVIARDLTERRHAEDERLRMMAQLDLAERLAALGRVSAGIAHEINNVLMGIAPFAEIISRTTTSAEIADASRHITTSIARGRRITHQLLEYTRPASPTTIDISTDEWLTSLEVQLRAILDDAITLEIERPDRGMTMRADRQQIEQVLFNLSANARDAMADGGRLTITVARHDPGAPFKVGSVPSTPMIHISVADEGPGIPDEHRARLFEPFFTTKRSGTGLGLPIAFELVRQNGGFLFVETEMGTGTTFHIFLPALCRSNELGQEPSSAEEQSRAQLRRVLIVEDDEPVAEGLITLLALEGVATRWVSRGGEALRAVSEFDPDLVLLDVGLPDISGTEVYAILRSDHPDLPVIFSTGHGDDRGEAESRTMTLRKPYGISDLLEAWRSISSAGG